MDRAAISELHYLASLNNVASILRLGILSHRLVRDELHTDISDPTMQNLRQNKPVAYAGQDRPRLLHSYANLFVHGRNSMLKAVCHRYGHPAIAVLQVSTDVLDLPGVVIADQNAASSYARFYSSPDGLRQLSEDYVLARSWGDPEVDRIDYWRRKSQRSAEVLVPDRVDPGCIQGVYVSCQEASDGCATLGLPIAPTIDADLFFQ